MRGIYFSREELQMRCIVVLVFGQTVTDTILSLTFLSVKKSFNFNDISFYFMLINGIQSFINEIEIYIPTARTVGYRIIFSTVIENIRTTFF